MRKQVCGSQGAAPGHAAEKGQGCGTVGLFPELMLDARSRTRDTTQRASATLVSFPGTSLNGEVSHGLICALSLQADSLLRLLSHGQTCLRRTVIHSPAAIRERLQQAALSTR